MFAGIYYCRARLVIQRRPGVIFIRRCTGSDQTPREPSRCPREPLALETAPRSAPPPSILALQNFSSAISQPSPSSSSFFIFLLFQRLFSSRPRAESNSISRHAIVRMYSYVYVYTRYNVKSYSLSDSPREERAVFVPPKGIPRICR